MLKRIRARDLLPIPAEELWDHLTGEFILVMDDGVEFVTNHVETCYSSYAWDFHRHYPDTPLLIDHHFRGVAKGRRLQPAIDREITNRCMMAVYDTYRQKPPSQWVPLDPDLWRLAGECLSSQYNGCMVRFGAYAGGIDIIHFHQVYDQPEIYEANRAVQKDEINIHEVYEAINTVIDDRTRLTDNPIALEYRSKLLRATQVHQNIGPRGRPTDMNSRIFYKPAKRGYVEGINDIYEALIESRSAARAAYYQEESLRRSEYFSRKLQFVAQNVQTLHRDCDCGSTDYLEWTLTGAKFDENGEVVRQSDLILCDGKFFMNDRTGKLKLFKPHDPECMALVDAGATVKFRTTLSCAHPDPSGVCSTCFGDLAVNVPNDANIGQWCTINMGEQATQILLSAKHLERSMALEKLMLSAEDLKYIIGGIDNSSYCMSPELEGKDVYLVFNKSQVESLNDIYTVEAVEDHPAEHYSEMIVITVRVVTPMEDGTSASRDYDVNVGVSGSREASLSYEMLNYIKNFGKRYKVSMPNDSERFTVSLAGWEWVDPIVVLPAKHYNNSDHVDQVARRLESRVTEMRKRAKLVNPKMMIRDLYDFVNWKLNVPLSCLEIILYSTTIASMENNDYSLPKPGTGSQPSVLSLTMKNRSMSVLMAFERQYDSLIDVFSFVYRNRFDHPFDGIFNPIEVFGNPPK